jgi:hypothetical protein
MNLALTMTLGDLVVAGSCVTAIVAAYFGLKHRLDTLTEGHRDALDTLDEHTGQLAELDAAVFGRRRNDDNNRRKRRNRHPQENPA